MVRQVMIVLLIAVAAAIGFMLLSGAPAAKDEAPPAAPAPAAADPAAAAGRIDPCPERLPAGVAELTCRCTSEATADGTVWGSGQYTDDSAICRAALHAGATGVDGGPVRVVEAPGRDAYPADISRSVASQAYGEWARSVEFRPVEAGR